MKCFRYGRLPSLLFASTALWAQADLEPPRLESISVTPTTVDTSYADATFEVTVRVTDDVSGPSTLIVPFFGPEGRFVSAVFQKMGGIGARVFTGTASLKIEKRIPAGNWIPGQVIIGDYAGRDRTLSQAELAAICGNCSVTARKDLDKTPPELTRLMIYNGGTASQPVPTSYVISAEGNDDSGVMQGGRVILRSPSGTELVGVLDPVGGFFNGRWSGLFDFTFPPFAEQGLWAVSFASLTDGAGNVRAYSGGELQPLCGACQVEVRGDPQPATSSPAFLNFKHKIGEASSDPQFATLDVAASLNGLSVTLLPLKVPWLRVTPPGGATPMTLRVEVLATGLAAGTYESTIEVQVVGATNSPLSIPVRLTVENSNTIRAAPSALSFLAAAGDAQASPRSFTVSLTGPPSEAFTASPGAAWVKVSPESGTLPATLNVQVLPQALQAANYSAKLTLTLPRFANSQELPITLSVQPAANLKAAPAEAELSYTQGDPSRLEATLQFTDDTGAGVQLTSAEKWITVDPAGGKPPFSARVRALPEALPPGRYSGLLTATRLDGVGQPLQVPVRLQVSIPPAISARPQRMEFAWERGAAAPPAQALYVSSFPEATLQPRPATDWVVVDSPTTAQPHYRVSVRPEALPDGVHTGSIRFSGVEAAAQEPVQVQLEIQPRPALRILENGVVCAFADIAPIAPAMLVRIDGANLDAPGVRLLVNGAEVKPLRITPAALWFVAPEALAAGPAVIRLESEWGAAEATATTAPAAPALACSRSTEGVKPIVAVHASGAKVTAGQSLPIAHPVRAGDLVLVELTGLGPLPSTCTADHPCLPEDLPGGAGAWLAGKEARLTQWWVSGPGVARFTVRLPETDSGWQPLQFMFDGRTTQEDALVAVVK
jgi:hypothetical protein